MKPNKEITTQWILIRGLARESRHWGEFPHAFEQALNAARPDTCARVDAIDLPGTGRYSEMKSPISMGQIAEFTREKFLELRSRQRQAGEQPARDVYLMAISLGGMVACRWLERWPDDFKGAVLINTSFKGFSPAYRRLAPASYRHLFDIVRTRDELARERAAVRMVSNRSDLYEITADQWAQIQRTRPVSPENFARQLIAAARFSPSFHVPPVPILVLNSLKDTMVHPSCSIAIAERWKAELRRHPTAGHDLTLDDGPWVIHELVEWWKRRK